MSERSYSELVSSYLEGWGYLAASQVVMTHSVYIERAAEWGMKPIQCAKNIDHKHRSGR